MTSGVALAAPFLCSASGAAAERLPAAMRVGPNAGLVSPEIDNAKGRGAALGEVLLQCTKLSNVERCKITLLEINNINRLQNAALQHFENAITKVDFTASPLFNSSRIRPMRSF